MSIVPSQKVSLLPPMLALIVGFFAGCVFVHDDYDGYDRPGQSACDDNSDCRSNQYCMRGQCEDLGAQAETCRSAGDCTRGDTCVNGVCNQSCSRNADCPNGGYCDGYYCQVTSRPDAGTRPTDGGTRPTDGGLPPVDGGSGCPRPPTDGGTGTPIDAGSAVCVRNADCPSGNYCINNACVRGCSVDSDCGAAQQCSAGLCRPRAEPSCTSASQCASGSDCVDGSCRVPCTSTTACATGSVCKVGYCQPSDSPGSGAECSVNCDCPSGERCVEGTCQL
ncbi:hypothetical protein D187_006342 [Cystobacter fuscus DSM 2262]|uniref:DUF7107 domain-containing protein n=1 Tax=Cystobacter fuscus (strain ATCC 25194 / DSM 2262 / NBRC 100088 / M29) TaxID=1242864 RepID=S9PKF0_CYSF2|nr:hypothetical protein [Cystobacter fuscus]EPX62932.1 hypothetical protein D187_006342 [Cystobacter fuscus DSM 2262]